MPVIYWNPISVKSYREPQLIPDLLSLSDFPAPVAVAHGGYDGGAVLAGGYGGAVAVGHGGYDAGVVAHGPSVEVGHAPAPYVSGTSLSVAPAVIKETPAVSSYALNT